MVYIKRFRKMTLKVHEKPRIIWKRVRLKLYGLENTYKD